MNLGPLLQERERLLGVIEEAKTARIKLRQINSTIAMFGDTDNVTLLPDLVECDKCGKMLAKRGMGIHRRRAHGIVGKTRKPKTA